MNASTLPKPVSDFVLVTLDQPPAKSPSGAIVIPESARQHQNGVVQAKVILVGPGKVLDSGLREPMSVKPGDNVWLEAAWEAADVTVDGVEYHLVRSHHIVAKAG